MSIFLQNGLMLTQGVYDKAYPTELVAGRLTLGGVQISIMQILILTTTAVLLVGLNALVFRTNIGT